MQNGFAKIKVLGVEGILPVVQKKVFKQTRKNQIKPPHSCPVKTAIAFHLTSPAGYFDNDVCALNTNTSCATHDLEEGENVPVCFLCCSWLQHNQFSGTC